jgi:purine-binding chemotaxis protein CheW
MIQGEKFAFDIQYIKQVSHLNNLTPLPCTPDFIAGIINYHGRIVTVINLSTFFELPDENLAENQIIILENSHQIIGILSNKIIGVRYLQLNELQSNVSTFTQNNYLMRGITNDHTVLLDGLNFFTNEKFIVNEMV